MKLNEITPQSISKVPTKELLSIHRRIHQLSGSLSKYSKPSKKVLDLLERLHQVHKILVNEMSRRKFKHQSDLTKKEGTTMSKLEQFIDLLLEDPNNEFFFGEDFIIPGSLRYGELLLEKKKSRWIQKAIEKPGSLHSALGVPQGEKIPAEKLAVKPSDSPKMKKRKILAKTLKKITRKRTGKGEEEEAE